MEKTWKPNKASIIYVLLLASVNTYIYNWRTGLSCLAILPLGILIEYVWFVANKK